MSKLDILYPDTAQTLRWQIPAQEAEPVLATLAPG